MSKLLPIFAQKIKDLRKSRKWTQDEAAKAIGYSLKEYQLWERGESNPNIIALPKIATVFGVSCDYLLGLIDEKNHDLHFICEYLGLSEEAVEKLHSMNDEQSKAFLSRLITEYGGRFHGIYSYIAGAIDSQKLTSSGIVDVKLATQLKAIGANPKLYDSLPPGAEAGVAGEMRDFKLSEASLRFRELIEDFVSGYEFTPPQPAPANHSSFNDGWGFIPKQSE